MYSKAWQEYITRNNLQALINNLFNDKQIQNNRYYIKSIAEVIQFLSINELAFRGNYNIELKEKTGIFQNLFEFSMKQDSKLKAISETYQKMLHILALKYKMKLII